MIIGGDYFRDESVDSIVRELDGDVKITQAGEITTYCGDNKLTQDQYERAILDLEFAMSRRKG